MSESLVFLSGKRTPFGANGGLLKDAGPTEMAVTASQAALEQAKVNAEEIQHVIFGNVLQSAPDSIYTPRHIGLKCGVPIPVPALGINRLCGSGFQVVVEAFHQMLAGDTKLALIGGVENMSMTPYLLRGSRWGMRMGHGQVIDMMVEALYDAYAQAPMAITAENLAVSHQISREQADAFALKSQKNYAQALRAGHFKDEITPFTVTDRKGNPTELTEDEHPRPETTLETLTKLKPIFKKDGVVTAGNASGIVDGAGALVVSTESEAKRRGATPLGRLVSYGISGCDPKVMGIGPVPASREALKRAGLKMSQMDLIDINEAFAPQVLAVAKDLEIPEERFNVNGGAIAVGHPLAASGARITMSALYELRRRKKRYALVGACIGGGQGIALVIEAL
ncbi:MAG: acetyl-CoA C-acetyltransferase [Bdellovibrionota bacterium]